MSEVSKPSSIRTIISSEIPPGFAKEMQPVIPAPDDCLTSPMQPYTVRVQVSACFFAVPEIALPLFHLGAVCSVDQGWNVRLPPSPPGHEETPG